MNFLKIAGLFAFPLFLNGCANAPLLSGLGLSGLTGSAYISCRLNGKAELVQGGGPSGLSTSQPLKDADQLCAGLKKP